MPIAYCPFKCTDAAGGLCPLTLCINCNAKSLYLLTMVYYLHFSLLCYAYSSESVALLEWWSGTEVTLYTDPENYQLYGKENAIVVLNHNFEIAFLCGWPFCERFGVLGVREQGTFSINRSQIPCILSPCLLLSLALLIQYCWGGGEEGGKQGIAWEKTQIFWSSLMPSVLKHIDNLSLSRPPNV